MDTFATMAAGDTAQNLAFQQLINNPEQTADPMQTYDKYGKRQLTKQDKTNNVLGLLSKFIKVGGPPADQNAPRSNIQDFFW